MRRKQPAHTPFQLELFPPEEPPRPAPPKAPPEPAPKPAKTPTPAKVQKPAASPKTQSEAVPLTRETTRVPAVPEIPDRESILARIAKAPVPAGLVRCRPMPVPLETAQAFGAVLEAQDPADENRLIWIPRSLASFSSGFVYAVQPWFAKKNWIPHEKPAAGAEAKAPAAEGKKLPIPVQRMLAVKSARPWGQGAIQRIYFGRGIADAAAIELLQALGIPIEFDGNRLKAVYRSTGEPLGYEEMRRVARTLNHCWFDKARGTFASEVDGQAFAFDPMDLAPGLEIDEGDAS